MKYVKTHKKIEKCQEQGSRTTSSTHLWVWLERDSSAERRWRKQQEVCIVLILGIGGISLERQEESVHSQSGE